MFFYPTILIAIISAIIGLSFGGLFREKKPPMVLSSSAKNLSFMTVPKVVGVNSSTVNAEDGTDELICQYLAKSESPMGKTCVEFSRIFHQYEIDPVFALAIAQCESNLGEKMPIPVSQNCYDNIQPGENPEECCHNPFGWGVHSEGTLCFKTWEEAYQKVGEGLKKKYVEEGLLTTKEIMSKYNKISAEEKNGSWARCINQFIDEIEILKVRKY